MEENKHSYKISKNETVSLAVYNVGFESCEKGYQWGAGVRDHYLIHHVLSGKGQYITENSMFSIKAGDTFLIYPFTEIVYKADENDPWEYYWIGFSGSDAEALLDLTDFSKQNPVISTDFGEKLKNEILNTCKAYGQEDFNAIRMTGGLYNILSIIVENSNKAKNRQESSRYYAQKAGEYIAHNYAQLITVEDIASYVGVSRSHLFRVFKKHYSASPKEFLSKYRIRKSCNLLKETSLSIGAIANSVGFEDSLYFSRVFKRVKGITPTEYMISKMGLVGKE